MLPWGNNHFFIWYFDSLLICWKQPSKEFKISASKSLLKYLRSSIELYYISFYILNCLTSFNSKARLRDGGIEESWMKVAIWEKETRDIVNVSLSWLNDLYGWTSSWLKKKKRKKKNNNVFSTMWSESCNNLEALEGRKYRERWSRLSWTTWYESCFDQPNSTGCESSAIIQNQMLIFFIQLSLFYDTTIEIGQRLHKWVSIFDTH